MFDLQFFGQRPASYGQPRARTRMSTKRLTCAGGVWMRQETASATEAADVRGSRKPKKKSLLMTRDLYDATGKIKPDPEDIELVERQLGPLPANPSNSQVIDRYRLAAAVKLIRLYAEGKLPPTLMRDMESCIER